MLIWDDAPLPKLPDLYSGIYVREGGARAVYEQLADEIAAVIYDPAESAAELARRRCRSAQFGDHCAPDARPSDQPDACAAAN